VCPLACDWYYCAQFIAQAQGCAYYARIANEAVVYRRPVLINTGVGNDVTLRNFLIIFIILVFCKEFTYQKNFANKIAITKNSQLRQRVVHYGIK